MPRLALPLIPTYVINLPHRADRLELFRKEAERIGVQPRRFAALPGGAIGATKSHLSVARIAKRNMLPYYLVCEDDAMFCDNFTDLFNKGMMAIPDEWDAIYLGGSFTHNFLKGGDAQCGIVRSGGANCLHAVIFHENFYNRLITVLEKAVHDNTPCDVAVSREHPSHNIYAFYPQIAFQTPGMSDITGRFEDYSLTLGANKKR